jgi:hypothetical protein
MQGVRGDQALRDFCVSINAALNYCSCSLALVHFLCSLHHIERLILGNVIDGENNYAFRRIW